MGRKLAFFSLSRDIIRKKKNVKEMTMRRKKLERRGVERQAVGKLSARQLGS